MNFSGKGAQRTILSPESITPIAPRIMDCYWSDRSEEQVCYDKDGKEYMRCDRALNTYHYPNSHSPLQEFSAESERQKWISDLRVSQNMVKKDDEAL